MLEYCRLNFRSDICDKFFLVSKPQPEKIIAIVKSESKPIAVTVVLPYIEAYMYLGFKNSTKYDNFGRLTEIGSNYCTVSSDRLNIRQGSLVNSDTGVEIIEL